jgi:hypothetical protein
MKNPLISCCELLVTDVETGEVLYSASVEPGSLETPVWIPEDLRWLGGEVVILALRNVEPGYHPLFSNRPDPKLPGMHGEVLSYDHELSEDPERVTVSHAITSDGIIGLLKLDEGERLYHIGLMRRKNEATRPDVGEKDSARGNTGCADAVLIPTPVVLSELAEAA